MLCNDITDLLLPYDKPRIQLLTAFQTGALAFDQVYCCGIHASNIDLKFYFTPVLSISVLGAQCKALHCERRAGIFSA